MGTSGHGQHDNHANFADIDRDGKVDFKDVGFISSLKRKLGVDLSIPDYPEYAGALGAALIAAKRSRRKQ